MTKSLRAAVGALATVAVATLLPFRRILGTSVAGEKIRQLAALREASTGKREHGPTWLNAPSRRSVPALAGKTFADIYGCCYHFGHDGRILLGRWPENGMGIARDGKGNALRGRARRRVVRRIKVRMLADNRHSARLERNSLV